MLLDAVATVAGAPTAGATAPTAVLGASDDTPQPNNVANNAAGGSAGRQSATTSSVSDSLHPLLDDPQGPEMPRKRHRPSSLDLRSTDPSNSDLALRLVSPGLPQLSAEMKSTVKMSQKIEQQQKSLIAARQQLSLASSISLAVQPALVDLPPPNIGSEHIIILNNGHKSSASSPSSATDELDKLLSQGSASRGLKRSNVPTPLAISHPNAPSGAAFMPSIQSAPIRPYRQPAPRPVRRFLNPQKAPYQIQVQPYTQFAPYGAPPRRLVRPVAGPPMHLPYMYQVAPLTPFVPQRRFRKVPYTPNHPRMRPVTGTVPSQPPAAKTPKTKNLAVTDVYHGDFTKAAPLQSQPLSAQKEHFESGRDDDRMPVSDEEIREMQEKYRDSSAHDPESAAIDEYDERHAVSGGKSDVFGSLNLMNESVFNFRIFSGVDGDRDEDRRLRDKDRFLKICETSWDEFVTGRT